VFGKMVGAHEPLITNLAEELLFPGVNLHVPVELITPGEAFTAEEPAAHEWLVSIVPAQVRSQVSGLTVDFPAPSDVAGVDVLLDQVCASWA